MTDSLRNDESVSQSELSERRRTLLEMETHLKIALLSFSLVDISQHCAESKHLVFFLVRVGLYWIGLYCKTALTAEKDGMFESFQAAAA